MISHRLNRLQDRIKKDVSDIIQAKLRDPRIGFVTVTRVTITSDYRLAKIFVSHMDDMLSPGNTIEGLKSASGMIRTLLGKELGIRRVPELRFILDDGIKHSLKMQKIFDYLETEKQPDAEDRNEIDTVE
jgi:ribosome-binding factor A